MVVRVCGGCCAGHFLYNSGPQAKQKTTVFGRAPKTPGKHSEKEFILIYTYFKAILIFHIFPNLCIMFIVREYGFLNVKCICFFEDYM